MMFDAVEQIENNSEGLAQDDKVVGSGKVEQVLTEGVLEYFE